LKQPVPVCATNFGKSFRHGKARAYDRLRMGRVVRRRGLVTFGVLVVIAEVVGRSLTGHVDRLFHVEPLARLEVERVGDGRQAKRALGREHDRRRLVDVLIRIEEERVPLERERRG